MYRRDSQGWLKHIDFILLDVIWLNIAYVIAYDIRMGFGNPYGDTTYSGMLIILSMADVLICIFTNNYKNVLKRGYYKEFRSTLQQVCLLMLCATLYLFATKNGAEVSRIVVGLTAVFNLLISYCGRLTWKHYLKKYLSAAQDRKLLIVTESARVKELVTQLQEKQLYRCRIVGVVAVDIAEPTEQDGVPLLPNQEDTIRKFSREWIDEVFIDIPRSAEFPEGTVKALMEMGIAVHIRLQENLNPFGQKQFLERMGNYTVLTSSINNISLGAQIWKRLIDIIAGLVGTFFTLILMLIIGPVIYIQSPGPILFKQIRVGKNGRKFKMYKFRSMCMDAEEKRKELEAQNRVQGGLMFKLKYDPRIIGCKQLPDGRIKKGIGNFIRDWSLDEFPQFINILKGDMSLVGTRPPTVDEWERYELHHRARLAIKPGLTGLWQVSGRSEIVDFEEVVKLDEKYIAEWNLGKDVRIILMTVRTVLKRDGAM